MDALAAGLMLTTDGDQANIDTSMRLYDALYAYCRGAILMAEHPTLRQKGFRERLTVLKESIRGALPYER